MVKRKKGFTLVELLAIIAVIGMMLIITSPYVLRSIANARMQTFQNGVEGIIRTIQDNSNENGFSSETFTITDGIIINSKGERLETSVGNGENGSALIDDAGRVTVTISDKNKKWCAKKAAKEQKVTITNYTSTCK